MKIFGDAVILCGGESKRMPFDKSFAKISGRYMIDVIYEKLAVCFENVRLCADSGQRFRALDLKENKIRIIEDIIKDRIGPAAGILSALSHATTKYVFIVANDMPLADPDHIEFMKHMLERDSFRQDALIPVNGGYIEPLYGFYAASLSGRFMEEINAGNYKIHRILEKINVLYMDEKHSRKYSEDLAMFTNINSVSDLERLNDRQNKHNQIRKQ